MYFRILAHTPGFLSLVPGFRHLILDFSRLFLNFPHLFQDFSHLILDFSRLFLNFPHLFQDFSRLFLHFHHFYSRICRTCSQCSPRTPLFFRRNSRTPDCPRIIARRTLTCLRNGRFHFLPPPVIRIPRPRTGPSPTSAEKNKRQPFSEKYRLRRWNSNIRYFNFICVTDPVRAAAAYLCNVNYFDHFTANFHLWEVAYTTRKYQIEYLYDTLE